MPSHNDDKMIILFFIIILASIINCDESSDNKYINKLPATDKKVFLDVVARRILDEVPDVKSIETSAADAGDVLEDKLKAQSDFVQKILKEEVDSLKAKRRNNETIKKIDEMSNNTHLEIDTENSTLLNQSVIEALNNTKRANAEEASVSNNDNITTTTTRPEVTEHIDLTFRAHEYVDKELNISNFNANNRKAENYEQFVPVKIKYDEEILNVQKRTSKGGNRKREIIHDSIEKVGGASAGLVKNKTRRRSEDRDSSNTTVNVNITTNDTKVNNNEIIKVSTTSSLVEETTITTTEVKTLVSETSNENIKKIDHEVKTATKINASKPYTKNLSNKSESSEFLGENISVENETEKKLIPIHQNKTTTRGPDLNITNLPTSENPKDKVTSITSLTTPEASSSTTVKVEYNTKKVSIMRDADDAYNKTADSTTTNEPPTTTETLIGLTTTSKNCNEKLCNHSKLDNTTDETHEETETTVSTSKMFTPSVTNAPDALSKSTSTKIIKKLKSALRGLKHAVSKHSPKDMHYGDMQIPNAYQVFEVDPDTPAFLPQKPLTQRAEKIPVHIYDSNHAFYNPHNRYESEPIKKQSDTIKLSSISETIEESLEERGIFEPLKGTDGKRMIKVIHDIKSQPQTHAPYRVRPRLEQLPNTHEEEHPFQIHKRGLKDSLKAVRGILYTNSMFGYVPTNHERELALNSSCNYAPHYIHQDLLQKLKYSMNNLRCQESEVQRKKNLDDYWNSAREDTREENHPNNNNKAYNSIMDFLKRYMKRPKKSTKLDAESNIQNMSYDIDRNAITINGKTYNIYDDRKLESILGTKEASSHESDVDKVNSWLESRKYKRRNKVHKESVVINGHENNKLAEVLNVLQKDNTWKSREVSSEEIKYLTSINIPKSNSDETSGEEKKPLMAIIQQKMPTQLKVKSYSNKKRKGEDRVGDQFLTKKRKKGNLRFDGTDGNFGKLDTIEKISIITPAIDLVENIEHMLAKNIKVARTNDEDLELHLNILKDLVKMDNTGLKRFDWLGTTVDIQAALRKLMDLTEKRIHHRHIHPNDINLLNYIQELYKKASDVLFQREEETRLKREEESTVLNDRPSKYARSFPKYAKTIRNPLKILDHIREMMHYQTAVHRDIFKNIDRKLGHRTLSFDEEFFIFLNTIQIRLENFHEAIKQIASITTYDHQNWFRNIKDLFLITAGDKEYLELLLHLIMTRFLDVTEENVMMGANEDFKQFMETKRAEVDRTEVELVFILKILKELKRF